MKDFEVVIYTGPALEAAIRREQKHTEHLIRANRWRGVRSFLKDMLIATLFVAGMFGAVWAGAVLMAIAEMLR